jgi:ribonuclease R
VSRKKSQGAPLPTKQQIIDFLAENPGKVGKREIARAFNVDADNRLALRELLRELEGEGEIDRGHRKRLAPAGALPEMVVLDIADTNVDGELIGRPVQWKGSGEPPKVTMVPSGRDLGTVGSGDRILARVRRTATGYEGKLVRLLHAAPEDVVGVYRIIGREGRLQPTDRRQRDEFVITPEQARGAENGEFVLAEILPGKTHGLRHARVKERLGKMGDPRSLSLIAIHTHDIPTRFPQAALDEAAAAPPPVLGAREDLRSIPLITIDPEDARDRDDAVWAEPDASPDNKGGWHIVVAIADVAAYVTPDSALDREARNRGNSCYFPDRVVPMLPEALSNGLCSLHQDEDRACLAMHAWLDADGRKLRHRFVRGLMRSRAALAYGQVQRAHDGQPDEKTAPLLETVIKPLYGAYAALTRWREAREPLGIDVPERKVEIGKDGFIARIRTYERFDAHKLIEEMMILANVAAAETLEDVRQPCMYRVHDMPSVDKLESLRQFLEGVGLTFARGQHVKPAHFNRVLEKAAGTPNEHLINRVVLRSQMQAVYSGENRGHFGLSLRRYAHFTSPIRRYSDLMVHRALVSGLKFGTDGLSDWDRLHFEETAEHISMTERRAMAAERDALDRFTAAFMSAHIGAEFAGRISGVTRFGLFVELADSGADGLIPIASIGDDYYDHDESRHSLVGRHNGRAFRLGDRVVVKLADADLVTGGLRLELVRDLDERSEERAARGGSKRPRRSGGPPRGRKRGRR